jgi:hypothetical protein
MKPKDFSKWAEDHIIKCSDGTHRSIKEIINMLKVK